MVRATQAASRSRRLCRPAEPGSVEVEVHFYTYEAIATAARTRLNRLARPLLRACTYPGFAHVNVSAGNWLFESNWLLGFYIADASRYPVQPTLTLTRTLASGLGIAPEDWPLPRFTVVRAVLDCLYFPRLWPVHSCTTRAARLLGVRRRVRVPGDLVAPLIAGDFGHVRPLPST
jgi:hypothetical protein